MKLYEYALVHQPKQTKREKEDGIEPEAELVDFGHLLAKDDKIAMMKVTKLIPASFDKKLEEVQICLRPF